MGVLLVREVAGWDRGLLRLACFRHDVTVGDGPNFPGSACRRLGGAGAARSGAPTFIEVAERKIEMYSGASDIASKIRFQTIYSELFQVADVVQTRMVTRGQRQPLHTAFAERLRQAYNASPLTQKQIADLVGLSDTTLSKMGRTMPAVDTLERVAAGLGVSACWLAFGAHGRRVFQQRLGPEEPMRQAGATAPPDPLVCAGLGQRLRTARETRTMTRMGLGQAAGTSGTTIHSLEMGRTMPGVDLCEALARALDVSPCWLAYGESHAKE